MRSETAATRPCVVTLGGGHGQAALLGALSALDVSITAVVGVADDGGCSGKLRAELGMPPPGDLRRCLTSLATDVELARRFEERLSGDEAGRCVGNLVIAEMFRELGKLSLAAAWAARELACLGRVVPAAETPGTLRVYDLEWGPISGESAIETRSHSPLVANVEGPETSSEDARQAIEQADFVFLGPGSFIGSTLAALTTADIAAQVARAGGQRILIKNLGGEASSSIGIEDHARVLADHMLIKSGGESASLDVLHHSPGGLGATTIDGSTHYAAPLANESELMHDIERLRSALTHHFGFRRRAAPALEVSSVEARSRIEAVLERARKRLPGSR